jgi:hypothetical protein
MSDNCLKCEKYRELLIELSLPDFDQSQLFRMRYSKEQLSRADIAIMVRKFLEENP